MIDYAYKWFEASQPLFIYFNYNILLSYLQTWGWKGESTFG